jgi:hypothetical protein
MNDDSAEKIYATRQLEQTLEKLFAEEDQRHTIKNMLHGQGRPMGFAFMLSVVMLVISISGVTALATSLLVCFIAMHK